MKIRVPSRLRSVYWKLRARQLDFRPWKALVAEIPPHARLAVVGNAGYLHKVGWGTWIDGHDVVIRMNNFQLRGHERAVGRRVDILLTNFSRYTIRFDNPEFSRARWLVSSRPVNFCRRQRQGIHDRLGEHVTAGLITMRRQRVFVPDMACFAAQTASLGAYPTTGLMGLRLVLDVLADQCLEVNFIGFSFFQGRFSIAPNW